MNSNRLLVIFSMAFLFCGLISNQVQSQVKPQEEKQQIVGPPLGDAKENSAVSYKLIPGINNTWGYYILVDNKMKIHQPSIPGLPGNEGFKTR